VRCWYRYRSKDRKVRGIVLTRDKEQVARLAGYPVEDLVIERVRWNGKEFVKCKTKA
jgi:hypothetical protein